MTLGRHCAFLFGAMVLVLVYLEYGVVVDVDGVVLLVLVLPAVGVTSLILAIDAVAFCDA